jgi:hypothetical protein
MKYPSENFLYFIWQNGLYSPEYFHFRNEPVVVTDPGLRNLHSGPDFLNARVKVGNTLWVGNVEIHVKASDWFRHGHHRDSAYDAVILHAVFDGDQAVFRQNGEEIPFVRINYHPGLYSTYEKLENSNSRLCSRFIKGIEPVYLHDWIGKLAVERLVKKSGMVLDCLRKSNYDWEECLYHSMARAFGMSLNADIFQMLAEAVPLRFILKNRRNPSMVNAAFFGQAGFLDELVSDDTWYISLQREYRAVKPLLPPPLPGRHLWKVMRSRPSGFPETRISQFASLVISVFPFFERVMEMNTFNEMVQSLDAGIRNYYVEYFLYGGHGRRKQVHPGSDTLNKVIVNGIVPVLYIYGKERNRLDLIDRIIGFLEKMPAEENEIVRNWRSRGMGAFNAFEAQALIQLEKNYCNEKKCLNCMIGIKILKDWKLKNL